MNTIYRGAIATFALVLMGSSALSAPAIQIETLYSFNPASVSVGGLPEHPGGLTVDEKGNLYGETSDPAQYLLPNPAPTLGGSVFRLNPPTKGQPSWTKTILHSFTGAPDGTGDVAIVYSHGKIYGTTDFGGNNSSGSTIPPGGTGIVFDLANGQTENILHTFCQGSAAGCTDGSPSSLVVGDQGVIYGTNSGSLFSLTPPIGKQSVWTETTIYSQAGLSFGPYINSFRGSCCSSLLVENDAIYVVGTVIATNKNILFKFTPPTKGKTSWIKTILYTFVDTGPVSLIYDHQGGFYGTTFGGVYSNGPFGTVFRLTPPRKGQSVWTNTVLYSFKGGPDDGGGPHQLVIDGRGSLYGISINGGNSIYLQCYHSCVGDGGTLFKLSPPTKGHTIWSETGYKFCSGQVPFGPCIDGAIPTSLVADKGTIYGSTYYGGNFGVTFSTGTIFKVTSP
jgi:hypothetical protein